MRGCIIHYAACTLKDRNLMPASVISLICGTYLNLEVWSKDQPMMPTV